MFLYLYDSKVFEKQFNADKTLAEKFINAVKRAIEKLRQFFKENPTYARTEYGKALQEAMSKVENRVQELWDEAVAQGIRAENKESGDNVIKFSLMNRDSFENNVKAVLNMTEDLALKNKQEGNFVRIMENTPNVILNNVENAKNLETIISFHSLYLAARKSGVLEGHYHNLGKKIINLPQYMSEPDAILLMDNGRLNLISEIDVEKKKGVISIELNTVKDINNKHNAYNLIISVFAGKNNYIRNNISKHAVKVKYEKNDLSQVNSQLYEWLASINDKSSFDNSVPQPASKINTPDEKSSDRFDSDYLSAVERGDMATAQQMVDEAAERAFKNSKIRDENGNVIPLSERFNEEKEDIRYQDRFDEYDNLFDMGEDLFEDDSKREIFDEMIEKYPDDALYIIKHAAEQTVENFLTKKNRCVALSACTAVLYSNLRCSVFHLLAQKSRRGLRELYLGGGGDFYAVAAEHYHSAHNVA